MTSYRAFVVDKTDDGVATRLEERTLDDLPEGEVTIRVAYSSVNYKDGLATIAKGRVARTYPLVPGIDLAGRVSESRDPRFKEGDEVLVTGYDIGVAHDGGYADYARVKADWVVKRPEGLSLRETMALGTAGFTAGLAVQRLEDNGLATGRGPVLVTGATGGVGSTAVAMLAGLGHEVHASTGKASEADYLKRLGAAEVLGRDEVGAKARPLEATRWAGAVDPVGGATLSWILATTQYGGSVASCGLTGGAELNTTVMPFILRGVNLLGIDSVYCPMDRRLKVWGRLAGDLKPTLLGDEIAREITLDELPGVLSTILKGGVRGRTIVRLEG